MNNLLLYGSVSRGDSNQYSDIDLLTVSKGQSVKKIINNVNISIYNYQKIKEMAESGSLFVYHLNKEGKILLDDNEILHEILFGYFKLKKDYNQEIQFAYNLINSINSYYSETMNYKYTNSKICWCLRTFYAGLGANQNIPIFSIKKSVEQFGKKAKKYLLIKNKDNYQKELVKDIIKHMESLYEFNSKSEIEFDNSLMLFKEQVMKRLRLIKNSETEFY